MLKSHAKIINFTVFVHSFQILIHGSILCRHGVLMLSESNLKFLGGEVDTLVEANTQLNVLESAM